LPWSDAVTLNKGHPAVAPVVKENQVTGDVLPYAVHTTDDPVEEDAGKLVITPFKVRAIGEEQDVP
jgi:hypothetical protein